MILPYGEAPAISFILHELAMYLLFALCVAHATRQGSKFLSYLLGGALFGLILEFVNVNAGLNYSYGQFWIMFGPEPAAGAIPQNIPLNIGLGWGMIIYTARLFSDRLTLPIWARSAVDALLALNIDLSMDVVAYRLNMWHWGWEFIEADLNPLELEYFGVPYANFFGWLTVVFLYALFGRLLIDRVAQKGHLKGIWLAGSAAAAILLAQLLLFLSITQLPRVLLFWFRQYFRVNFGPFAVLTLIAVVLLAALIFYGRHRGQGSSARSSNHYLVWLVPAYFHLYFLSWFFIEGYFRESIWLLAITLGNAAVGLLLHGWGQLTR